MKIILFFLIFINSLLFASVPKDFNLDDVKKAITKKCKLPSEYTLFTQTSVYDETEKNRHAWGDIDRGINCYGASSRNNDGSIKAYSVEYDFLDERTSTYHWYNVRYNVSAFLNSIVSQSTSGNLSQFNFADGSVEFCNTVSQTCDTMDKNGKTIPNLPINGTTYNSVDDAVTNKFLNIGGVLLSAIGGTAIVVGTAGLGTPAAIATVATGGLAGGLFMSGTAFTGNNPYITSDTKNSDNLSSTPKGIKIDLKHMDFTKELPQVIKKQDASGATVKIIHNNNGSKDIVKQTSDTVEVTHVNPDESSTKYIVPNKSLTTPSVTKDFSEVNNPPKATITKVVTPAPTINNDGSKDWHADIVYKGVYGFGVNTVFSESHTIPHKSITQNNKSTATKTSVTTDSSGAVTSKTTSSTTTDLSPITNRLDKLSNQNIKNNSNIDKKLGLTNDTLKNIKTASTSIDSKLGLTNIHLKNIDKNIQGNGKKIDKTNKHLGNIESELIIPQEKQTTFSKV